MQRADPGVRVSFPPLATEVGLDEAPHEVFGLIADRWMAEIHRASDRPSFRLRWRLTRPTEAPEPGVVDEVNWAGSADAGTLANAGGRVVIVPGADLAQVELRPWALSRPESLEPLVEAALGYALAAHGECFLHASAFELCGRRLLVVGGSGAGKSTLAAAAAASGGLVVSDDSLLLGLSKSRPLVRAARRHVWLRPGSEALVRALERQGLPTQRSRNRFRLAREEAPGAFKLTSLPDCLVLLRPPATAEIGVSSRRLSQGEGLAALLRETSSLWVTDPRLVRPRRPLLDLLSAFAEALPAIELRIGPMLLESPEESLAAILEALP